MAAVGRVTVSDRRSIAVGSFAAAGSRIAARLPARAWRCQRAPQFARGCQPGFLLGRCVRGLALPPDQLRLPSLSSVRTHTRAPRLALARRPGRCWAGLYTYLFTHSSGSDEGMTARFEEWVEAVFNHAVGEPEWY